MVDIEVRADIQRHGKSALVSREILVEMKNSARTTVEQVAPIDRGMAERNMVGRGYAGARPDDAGRSTLAAAEADKPVNVEAERSSAVVGESTSRKYCCCGAGT